MHVCMVCTSYVYGVHFIPEHGLTATSSFGTSRDDQTGVYMYACTYLGTYIGIHICTHVCCLPTPEDGLRLHLHTSYRGLTHAEKNHNICACVGI